MTKEELAECLGWEVRFSLNGVDVGARLWREMDRFYIDPEEVPQDAQVPYAPFHTVTPRYLSDEDIAGMRTSGPGVLSSDISLRIVDDV
ncbi:hypothetical protein GCM10023212_41130 [Luteolibacter yonseiensis]|uniref:hypothetical protein n=1 Tax=Luteolibacter yonseiensis TaxID=1144680 RepID=UPI0031EE7A9E